MSACDFLNLLGASQIWSIWWTIYQMDHIWEAPSVLIKSLALIFLKKSAFILRQDFLKTLYVKRKQPVEPKSKYIYDFREAFIHFISLKH